jgi:UDP-glucose 4-epimerase
MSKTGNDHPTSRSPWLVTGGAGYIGGHVMQALSETGIPAVLLDIDAISAQKKLWRAHKGHSANCKLVRQIMNDIEKI